MRSLRAGLTRIRILNLRELRTHRLRMLTSLAVVVVSSALLVAVLSTYSSLTESVRKYSDLISGSASLEVAAIADTGIDEELLRELRRDTDGVRAVVPMIQTSIVLDDRKLALIGSDYRIMSLSPELRAAVEADGGQEGEAGTGLDAEQLRTSIIAGPESGLTEGQRISVGDREVTVARVVHDGAATGINGGRFVFAYLGLAQELAGLPDRVDSILLVTEDGTDDAAVAEQVERIVDGRAVVVDPEFRAEQAETAGSVTRDATLLVSMVSLIIAAFLVFNTMNMAVAARRRSLAMIRAMGARRRHLVGDLLGESAIFGLLGGAIGVPVGIGAGYWAISQIPETSAGPVPVVVGYHLPTYAPIIAVIACVVACVAATALAARSLFSLSPVEAMSSGEAPEDETTRGTSWWAGLIAVAALVGSWVIVMLVPGRPAILAGAVYAVGALLLCFAFANLLVRAVVAIARRFGGPGQLTAVNAGRNPRRVWATVMTVAVAVAVGIGTSGALNNLVSSLSSSLDGLGDPDFYVSTGDADTMPLGPALDPVIEEQARAVPGVTEIAPGQWAALNVDRKRILMQGLVPGSAAPFLKKVPEEVGQQALDGEGVLLSTVLARELDLEVGEDIRLATPTGFHSAPVLAVVDYASVDSGVAAMAFDLLAEWFDRDGATYLQVFTDQAADQDAIRAALEEIAAAHPAQGNRPVSVYSGAEALAGTQQSVEQSGAFTVAIQWIVSAAAAVALLNTLLLSVLQRRREIGVLRAMGASRRFVFRMVLAEAGAVAIVGAVVGVVIGTVLHLLSNEILTNTTAIDVRYSPQWSIAIFVALSAGLCVLGAVIPASRASRLNISEAIANE